MNRRLTQRGRDRRQQLMAYATGRFAENGYHPTSVAEIVQGLGVGKGVFYWYFASKEELFLEILRDAQRQLRRRQEAAIADEPDPVVRIELGIRASVAWFHENPEVVKLLQFAATEERFAPVLRRGQDVAVADTARHVKEGIGEGRIRDIDPFLLSHAVLGVTGHLAREFVQSRSQSVDEVADAAVAFCLEGLLGR
jgi:AcrR family transcriptional regulator